VGEVADPPPVEYESVGGVLESPEHGPLIVSSWLESYPPQTDGGLRLTNWNWAEIPDAESAQGTTWVESYRLVGTWDGSAFTLTRSPVKAAAPAPTRIGGELTPGCDEGAFFPVLDFVASLDHEVFGIRGGSEDVFDGQCGARVIAWFDTPELREAVAPMADRVSLEFTFTPLD
jgi:hypothetical protein